MNNYINSGQFILKSLSKKYEKKTDSSYRLELGSYKAGCSVGKHNLVQGFVI